MKMKWLNISTSLAAILTALIALFTLYQVKNQNEFAHQADLAATVKNADYAFYYEKENQKFKIKKFKSFQDSSQALQIILANIGLGIAKNTEVTWNLNYQNLVGSININETNFKTDAAFNPTENSTTLNEIMLFDDKKKMLNYILPLDKAKESSSINVPYGFQRIWLNLLGRIIEVNENDLEKCEQYLNNFIKENSILTFNVSYTDVFNKKHRKTFKLYLYPSFISLHTRYVGLTFEVKEVFKNKKNVKTIEYHIFNENKSNHIRLKL